MSLNIRQRKRSAITGSARILKSTAAVLALGSLGYFSSVQVVHAQNYSFSQVSIDGAEQVSANTILSYAGIERGASISAAQLNDAYQAVLASGLFETVEFVPQGNRLVIKVVEFPTVSRIAIEGNKNVDDDVLMSVLQTQVRRVYSPAKVELDAAEMTKVYESKGKLAATVVPRIIRRNGNRVDVVFEVSESKDVEVERLSFVGNRVFGDQRLRQVLETKQAGAFRFLVGRDTYSVDRINFDKTVLSDFYKSRGYVDFQILNVGAEFSRDRDAYFLTFTVREGQKFSFNNVTTVSEMSDVDANDFKRLAKIRTGQTYSPVIIEQIAERMERLATKKGIDFLKVDPRITRNDRDQSLDVEFALVKGPRIFVERIDIEGNATTLDRVVRTQFRTVEGDPFNAREIRAAASRIRALGYFSNAQVNTREGASGDRVIVDVDLDETPTGSFSFGANYSVSDGASLLATFSEKNFLGRGQQLSFNLTTQLDDGNLSFRFVEPAFLGRNVAFSFASAISATQPTYAEHEERSFTFSPSLTFPVSELGRLQVNYKYELSELTNDDANTIPVLIQNDIDDGRVDTHSIGYQYTWDSRGSGLNPDAGMKFSFAQSYGTPLGDVEYIRTTAELLGETTIFNGDVDLRAVLEGGMIQSDDGTRVSDRFFNTSSTLRGFDSGGIGPRDTVTGVAVGGNYYASARVEAEFPIGLPEEYGIRGGVFFDTGSVWGLDDPGTIDDDFYLRSVIGASVFWNTPIGPLRFNFSHAMEQEDYDEEQTFDLTLSTQF